MTKLTEAQKSFAQDILNGFQQSPKRLYSKYFYNAEGDRLFQEIMKLDEYYLTRTEEKIIKLNREQILNTFSGSDNSFRLIELGAGDGTKTKILLDHFAQLKTDFIYSPIDISENVLVQLKASIEKELPSVKVEPIQGDYFKALAELKQNHLQKEVVLFLGSTIGNFNQQSGTEFLKTLSKNLTSGDLLFIGFDLMKNPRIILSAYDDQKGVTKDFNLNLLKRINHELGANFQLEHFIHYPTYDPVAGETRSYIVSSEDQTVHIKALEMNFHFKKWEAIHTEISKKFSMQMIESTAQEAGFKIIHNFMDEDQLFVDSLWEKI